MNPTPERTEKRDGGTHTPWNDRIMFTGMTGPTTPAIGGPTVEEQCAYNAYWRAPEPRDKNAYPRTKHTPIGFGQTVTAIAVGENHKERAAFIVKAVNSHADLVAQNEALRGALEQYAQSIGIWWTMVEADRECSEQEPLKPEAVVLHFMGSGASTQVSVSDLRELNAKVQTLLTTTPMTEGRT